MSEARIVVDASTIRPGTNGPSTGDICLELGEHWFPDRHWNDFVVVILEAWCGAVSRLLRSTSEHERVYFMEGPYVVDISCRPEGILRLRAIQRGRDEQERATGDTRAGLFIKGLLVCAEEALSFCRQRGNWSADEAKLDATLAILREQTSKLTKTL